MLGVALADDASHAGALDDLAMLADRLHAAADFHRRSGLYEVKGFRPDPNSSGHTNFMQVTSDQRHPSWRSTSNIAARGSAAAVTARPKTT